MFNHVGFNVSDLPRSLAFWRAVLEPLGYGVIMSNDKMAMLGDHASGYLWIGVYGEPASPIHVALQAKNRAAVAAFHQAALAAGGRDNGAPGLRPNYAPTYYAAFAYDPDGHNVEAVTHSPT
jgi:catechol 2,3-dioxygenase-like lactoylglutathione lyase family enzyme